jgi:putative hydrolase of the HAD superfamily
VFARHLGQGLACHLFARDKAGDLGVGKRLKIVRSLQESVYPLLKTRNLKGLVFDLDDTLIAHRDWILEKARHVAGVFAPEMIDDWMAAVHRLVDEGQAGRLYDELVRLFSMPDLREAMIDLHRSHQPYCLTVYEDVAPALRRLKNDFQLVLLSDNPGESQRQKLERFALLDCFDEVILTDELGTAKPSPAAFRAVCSRTGLKPDQLAMIGDNFHRDILGAQGAGYGLQFHVVRDDRMFNTRPFGSSQGSVITVRDLMQLVHCLE